jgi:hypothetical protein
MSGTAVALGAGYGGYAALEHFMNVFRLDSAVQDSVLAIYHVGIAIGKTVGVAGASAASGAMNVFASTASGAIRALPAMANATRSVAYTGAMAGPLVALGRYVGTQQSARDELQYILSQLEGQYRGLTNKIGTVTRSVVDKKELYANEIRIVRRKIDDYNKNTQAVAEVATKNTINSFQHLKHALCVAIDKGIKAQTDIANISKQIENIFNPYYGIDMNIAFGGKRRKSVRGSNSRNSRSTSKGRKSGKQSKKMKGKRGKKSVKRSYSKR